MNDKAREAIGRYGMLMLGDRVTAAVSGGADSVALLQFLASYQKRYALALSACHVNHGLRGEESERDENFVRELCKKLDIPLIVVRVDAAREARETGLSLEEAARRLRYRALEEAAAGGKIATAHTLTDSMETTLFNMARGTGLRGLLGIPPVRGLIIRPLILCTRAQTEAYCTEHGLSYVTDSTNLTDAYTRNYIRRHIVPHLYRLNPSFDKTFARMAALLSEDEAQLCASAQSLLDLARRDSGYRVEILNGAGDARLNRALALWLRRERMPYDSPRITLCAEMIRRGRGGVQLASGVWMRAESGLALIHRAASLPEKRAIEREKISFEGICLRFGDRNIRLRREDCEQRENFAHFYGESLKNALDCDRIDKLIFVRPREAGDRLRQPGRGLSKPLGRLYAELGVPASRRDGLAVLSDSRGVLWAEKAGADEAAAVNPSTRHILWIEAEETNLDTGH
jgi:tRNA(Ile)-lysidine synthase